MQRTIVENYGTPTTRKILSLKKLEFLELVGFKKSKQYEMFFPEKALQSLKNRYNTFFEFAV